MGDREVAQRQQKARVIGHSVGQEMSDGSQAWRTELLNSVVLFDSWCALIRIDAVTNRSCS